jgi:hypothetical protein
MYAVTAIIVEKNILMVRDNNSYSEFCKAVAFLSARFSLIFASALFIVMGRCVAE